MSRTHRRGQRSRNLHQYLNNGVIWSDRAGFTSSRTGDFVPYWHDPAFPDRSYWEYVLSEVRDYHREKGSRGITRWIRKVDTANQTRQHKLAISQAIKTKDYDVVLVGLDQMYMMCNT